MTIAAGFALATALLASATVPEGALYTQFAATTLPSTNTDWDYMRLSADGARLFIARRKDGLTVFDTKTRKALTVANSIGANGPLLLPQFDRGYVAMTDGSLLSFKLSTLKVIERRPLDGDGGLNGVIYDPATKRIHAITGPRPERSTWHTLDAATGKVLGKTAFPFKKMDDAAADGRGHIYAPARYDGLILKLNSETLAEEARWSVPGCEQVVVVEHHGGRLLVGCRGAKPVFLTLDPATGATTAPIPIAAGIDGMVVDEARHRVLASGVDSRLTVIAEDGPGAYRLLGDVQTQPMARIMQVDQKTGRVFLIAADHTVPAPKDGAAVPPVFHPDSFTVLEYEPR
jgi:hypothetical protein